MEKFYIPSMKHIDSFGKKILLLIALFFIFRKTDAQIFYTENFNNGCSAACSAVGYIGTGGAWTQTITGVEGTDPNAWFVSCAENNTGNGNCSSGCGNNQTLHISAGIGNPVCPNDCGAAYDAGGLCGFLTCPQTDRRIESPTINCSGQTGITVNFNYISAGAPPNDQCSIWYFDGAIWTQLSVLAPTNNSGCGGQGRWTAYPAISLPVSANNNPLVKIGFRWTNNDDGVGTDPSVAIDDLTLTATASAGPIAAFTVSTDTICIGQSINFTDASTGSPTAWTWTFPSGTPASASTQNVNGVTWNTAGTYTVTLNASNSNGNTSATQIIYVSPNPVVTAIASPSTICVGQQSTLTASGATTYVWNPGNLTGSSVTVTPGSTTTYTVTGTNAAGCTGTAQVTVNVQTCSVPIVFFSASDTAICVGDCINFTDQSTNLPTTWNWTFSGSTTASSSQQNPTNICYPNAGTFAVTLVVTNANGSGSLTKTGYIIVNPPPVANAGPDGTICTGQQTTLLGSGGGTYNWNPGNLSGSSVSVTPLATTTYTLTVTDANGCTGTDQVTITVNACTTPTAALSVSANTVCEGTCIDFTDNSTGTPTGWQWAFPGGTPVTSTQQNPANICYNIPGVYPVTLIVTNAFGSDTILMTNYVTVGAQPVVNAGAYTVIAIGNTTQLNATGGTGSWSWSPTTGLSNPSIQNPTASPTVTTTYTVNFTDANGCSGSDTVTVEIIEYYSIFVPSAFSPNGDGSNEVLFVRGGGIKTLDFLVFDRYGEKVFESTSINDGWDGTLRGKPMNTGIYVYVVKADFYNGTSKTLKGDVTLVR